MSENNNNNDTQFELINTGSSPIECPSGTFPTWQSALEDFKKLTEDSKKNPERKPPTGISFSGYRCGLTGTKAVCTALESHPYVQILDMGNSCLGSSSAMLLSKHVISTCSALTAVHLQYNKIGDSGVEFIANAVARGSCPLEILDFAYNEIGDEGARSLAALMNRKKTLKMLFLSVNHIQNAGAIALASSLETNDRLKVLHLNFNEITNEGGKAFLAALKKNKTISHFYIQDNPFSTVYHNAIEKIMKDEDREAIADAEEEEEEEEEEPDNEEGEKKFSGTIPSKFDNLLDRKLEEIPEADDGFEEYSEDRIRDAMIIRTLEQNKLNHPEDIATHVATVLYLNKVDNVDNVTETTNIDVYFLCYYKYHYNVGRLYDDWDPEKVFQPDIEFANGVDIAPKAEKGINWINLNWSPYGIMVWNMRFLGTISSPMQLHKFPFDMQEIKIQVKSEGFGLDDFRWINVTRLESARSMSKAIRLTEWDLSAPLSVTEDKYYAPHEDRDYSLLLMTIPIRRKSSYYVTKIMSLLSLLVIMSWVVFFMPQDGIGDRCGLLFTLFLAAVAFHFVVSTTIPKTSYETIMDRFIEMTYAFLFIPSVETVIVKLVNDKDPHAAEILDWVCLGVLAFSFFVCCAGFALVGYYTQREARSGSRAIKS